MPYPEGLPILTIWDEIAFYLISTKDLLSLALTCRDFKDLIIPDHLEYRYIACDIRQSHVWKFLGSRPRLARGIRAVKLLRGPRPLGDVRLPRALYELVAPFKLYSSDDDDLAFTDDDVASFSESLPHITFLKELSLIQSYSTISQNFADTFMSLLTSSVTPSLEGLSVILIPRVSSDGAMTLPRHGEILKWPLTRLKRVVVFDSIQAAIQFILFCPDIEDLYLSELSNTSTSYLMPLANWTKLRRFSLTFKRSLMPAEDFSAIMSSFFHRHTGIESLYLILRHNPMINQPPLYLPNLRSVSLHSTVDFSLTSFLSSESISRLVHLDCPITDIDALPLMESLQSFCLVLSNSISFEQLSSFLLRAPNLKKICLDCLLVPSFWRDVVVEVKIINIFLQCIKLTHIFCDFPASGSSDRDLSSNQSLGDLCQSLSPLQELTYLQVHSDGGQTILELERNENGYVTGYQSVTLEEAGGGSRHWGNIFLRL